MSSPQPIYIPKKETSPKPVEPKKTPHVEPGGLDNPEDIDSDV